MKSDGFTIIELLVVIGVIVILGGLLFSAARAQLESARINEMRSQLQIFEAALAEYRRAFGDVPPSFGSGENTGSERLLAHLRSTAGGGPFVQEHLIEKWVGDTDGDGRQELVDPWRNPWIYFHPSDYSGGAVYCRLKGKTVAVSPVKKGDAYVNLTSHQLWACGPNQVSESGQGDDAGNTRR